MSRGRERLDKLVVEQGLAESRSKGQALIMAGDVQVDGETVTRPAALVDRQATIALKARAPYVSRGGFKLAAGLDRFGLSVAGKVCADVGACTGGFTDVLLQRDAARVYAIDVGYGQLDWRLRQDERVVVMERTNARHVEALAEQVDFAAIDVSFISLRLILPAVRGWLAPGAQVVALVKPQFEAGPARVGKGGVVRDAAVHRDVLTEMAAWASGNQWQVKGLTRSPIEGAAGNEEFLMWLAPREEAAGGEPGGTTPAELIDHVLSETESVEDD